LLPFGMKRLLIKQPPRERESVPNCLIESPARSGMMKWHERGRGIDSNLHETKYQTTEFEQRHYHHCSHLPLCMFAGGDSSEPGQRGLSALGGEELDHRLGKAQAGKARVGGKGTAFGFTP